jgi:hypothetical protein
VHTPSSEICIIRGRAFEDLSMDPNRKVSRILVSIGFGHSFRFWGARFECQTSSFRTSKCRQIDWKCHIRLTRDRFYYFLQKMSENFDVFCSNYRYFFQKNDHNIGFWEKRAYFFAENCRTFQKIVIMTSTPVLAAQVRILWVSWWRLYFDVYNLNVDILMSTN